jgi:predicted AAA+ superfamily ATPase
MDTLKQKNYQPRLIDDHISMLLSVFGAVQIDGPKYCGKTWTAKAHSNSELRLDNKENRALAIADPNIVLKGESPRLIDEWQEVPSIRDDIRRHIDEAGNEPGQFILTGSSVPPRNSYVHSGAGRIARVNMRPMSLYEMKQSDGRISLKTLFNSKKIETFQVETALDSLASLVCRGGWPAALGKTNEAARLITGQYLEAVIEDSAPIMGRTSPMARRALSSLARNNGTATKINTISSDMAEGEHDEIGTKPARSTIESYLDFFRDIYLLEELFGWDAPIRSKKRLRTKPKRYLVDPSLALSMLGMNENSLLMDLQTFGIMFETMCIRDLRVYTSVGALYDGVQLRYYSDDSGMEVDVIIELKDGRWGCIEIKLSEDKVADAVKNLVSFKEKISKNEAMQVKQPSFLAVLVGRTSYARTTKEGVHVIPITSLTA